MLPPPSTPRSKMGAFLIPSLGIDRQATTWLGPAAVLLVPGRNFGCWWGGDKGSPRAGIGWVTTGAEPSCTRPSPGSALAIKASPPAISSPAIRFRRILFIIVRGIRNAVNTSKSGRRLPGADARIVESVLRGLAGGRTDVGLANSLGE